MSEKDIEVALSHGSWEAKTKLPHDATPQQIEAAWKGVNAAYKLFADAETATKTSFWGSRL